MTGQVLISSSSSDKIRYLLDVQKEVFCDGLFLSARWFVVSNVAKKGIHLIVLPTQEAAEYCTYDLYNLIEGDRVFFLPSSGKSIERSNYKSSLAVQRTAAIGKITTYSGDSPLFIVSYPDALQERVPGSEKINSSILTLKKGEETEYEGLKQKLYDYGFEKVDFVSAPGQFAVRGSLIDIFSYSFNDPYRVSFWGDEIEEISVFDCNTQLSKKQVDSVDIISDAI